MNWDAIGAIAEIIGVLAVVASLVYVAKQLGQNTDMMRAESRNAIHHGHQQELFTVVQHPDVWRGFSNEELDDDGVRLNMWLTACLRSREHEWFQLQHGALDQTAWDSYSGAVPIVLASERARAWWEASMSAFDREFVRAVNDLLDDESLNATHRRQLDAISTVPRDS